MGVEMMLGTAGCSCFPAVHSRFLWQDLGKGETSGKERTWGVERLGAVGVVQLWEKMKNFGI
ncbi:hypothetical protein KY290_016540 [Solanum tuberosum]|uniref:Uncharacterized protein n=1 Tax=Solanum tuberosum TaxID=4113 RepID=A0ABQ7V8S1_SOLTU|nr:hypothetical protein KY290_016540 [Solanum tuberosum]